MHHRTPADPDGPAVRGAIGCTCTASSLSLSRRDWHESRCPHSDRGAQDRADKPGDENPNKER